MKTWMWIVCIISVVGLCVFFSIYFSVTSVKYEKAFEVYADEYNVDKALLMAVAKTESGFNKDAKSSAGAIGVMQLMPATAEWVASELGEEYKKENLYNAEVNIKYGSFYLSYLVRKYENLIYALACYNAGEGVVSSWDNPENFSSEDIKYAETKNFVKKVLTHYEAFKM